MKSGFKFLKIYLLILGFAFSLATKADPLEIKWNPIPGAEVYEYELSVDGNFKPENLFRQGEVSTVNYQADVPPGLYFFRLRPVDKNGAAGPWSPIIKKLIKVGPPIVRSPKSGEVIEISDLKLPLAIEWKSVKGAEDYLVEVKHNTEKIPQKSIVPLSRFILPKNVEGLYQIEISARAQGSVISDPSLIKFELKVKPLSPPRILFPLDLDILTAYETHKIRWVRTVAGSESRVDIKRITPEPSGRISHVLVSEASETWLPPLPPGRYQIQVTDYLDDKQLSVDSVTLTVEQDPMGFHAQYIGTTWRFFSGGFNWGRRSFSNDQIAGIEKLTDAGSGGLSFPIQTRIQSEITDFWGSEVDFRFEQFQFKNTDDLLGPRVNPLKFKHLELKIGPTYKILPWGGVAPVLLKGLFSYRRLAAPYSINYQEPYSYKMDSYGLLSLVAGAEVRWSGWKAKYDLSASATTYLPLLLDKGSVFGRGNPYFLVPLNIQFELYVRRKIGDVHRLLLGASANFERLSHSEGPALHNGITTRSQRSIFNQWSIGPRLGWEWDL